MGDCNSPADEACTDASDLEKSPKADCVYRKLTNTILMKRYLQKFDGDFSNYHLKYELSSTLPVSINGRTINNPSDLGKEWMKILINANTLAERPTLGVARTFIHETIHAEMWRKIKSVHGKISIQNFPGLFDYYSRYKMGDNGTAQHNLMAQHYIDIMADALKEFDSSYSDEVYKAIAWVGLTNTVAWNNKSGTEKNRIITIVKQLKQNGSKNCNN